MQEGTCRRCTKALTGQQKVWCSKECDEIASGRRLAEPHPARTCPVCGESFTPTTRTQVCCPPTDEDRQRAKQPRSRCAKAYLNASARGTLDQLLARGHRPGLTFDCAQCGKRCVPGEGGVAPHATRFCGYECKAAWHRYDSAPRRRIEERRRARRARAIRVLAKAKAGARGRVRQWTAGPCVECGAPFVSGRPDAIGCSAPCTQRHQRRRSKAKRAAKYGWNDSHRARARRNGVEYETVSTPAVFARDGYRCGICGEPTDPDAVVPDGRAPTLDHILPMSKGGPHLYSNTQCACFECNWRKRDTVEADQLRFAA